MRPLFWVVMFMNYGRDFEVSRERVMSRVRFLACFVALGGKIVKPERGTGGPGRGLDIKQVGRGA